MNVQLADDLTWWQPRRWIFIEFLARDDMNDLPGRGQVKRQVTENLTGG